MRNLECDILKSILSSTNLSVLAHLRECVKHN